MHSLFEHQIHCPYCGESIGILVDGSIQEQEYIEDCQVCCRPIRVNITASDNGELAIMVFHENE
ncbi:MAG TPA: CPXCG motif-containing cysteine-rich protein [Pseudomonadales bacterium]